MRSAAIAVFLALSAALATAQDEKRAAPLPPPAKKLAPTADNKLPEAERAFLLRAAARQGGDELAGGVTSLQLHFGKVRGWRPTQQDDGVMLRKEFTTDRAAFAWRRHDNGEASFIEHLTMNGKTTSRCIFAPRKAAWIWAAGEPQATNLSEDTHAEDLEQLRQRRQLIGTLADLLVLGNALGDGSRWSRIQDKTHDGRAFLRRPPESARGALPYKVWIHEDSHDLVAVRIPPLTRDGQSQDLRFTYAKTLPRVHGASMRVPMLLKTHDRDDQAPTAARADDESPRLELYIQHIEFAPLPDLAFRVANPAKRVPRESK